MASYDSLEHTLHSQDPLGKTVRHFWHTRWLHSLHWLEKRVSRLRGSRHRPQLCWLYLPLPRLAPFLFTSSNSVFSFLRQKETTLNVISWKCKFYRIDLSISKSISHTFHYNMNILCIKRNPHNQILIQGNELLCSWKRILLDSYKMKTQCCCSKRWCQKDTYILLQIPTQCQVNVQVKEDFDNAPNLKFKCLMVLIIVHSVIIFGISEVLCV